MDICVIFLGFPCTLRCCLSNTSLAPMTFNLRIPEDGLGEPSIYSSVQIFKINHQSWRKGARGFMKPREFEISPCRGTVRALGSQDIKVWKESSWWGWSFAGVWEGFGSASFERCVREICTDVRPLLAGLLSFLKEHCFVSKITSCEIMYQMGKYCSYSYGYESHFFDCKWAEEGWRHKVAVREMSLYKAGCFSSWSHFFSPGEQNDLCSMQGSPMETKQTLCSHELASICWATLFPQLPAVKLNSVCSSQQISSAFMSL